MIYVLLWMRRIMHANGTLLTPTVVKLVIREITKLKCFS